MKCEVVNYSWCFFFLGEGVGYVTSSVCCVHFSLAKSRGLGLLLLFVSTFGVTGLRHIRWAWK